jgi:hypothetical protein
VEHVVPAGEGTCTFECQHVERLFDHAQAGIVTRWIRADRTERPGADVEAALAEDHVVAH